MSALYCPFKGDEAMSLTVGVVVIDGDSDDGDGADAL